MDRHNELTNSSDNVGLAQAHPNNHSVLSMMPNLCNVYYCEAE